MSWFSRYIVADHAPVEVLPEDDVIWDQKYPKVTGVVSGLSIIDDIPNTSSIGASFEQYTVLPGIREVLMSSFDVDPKSFFYATNDFQHSRQLAEQIKQSQSIKPLIIAIDEEGPDKPYILEGGHRFLALHYLGVKSFPAIIVLDKDQVEPYNNYQEHKGALDISL